MSCLRQDIRSGVAGLEGVVMPARILRIGRCTECHHCHHLRSVKSYCDYWNKDRKGGWPNASRTIADPGQIPDWCSLPREESMMLSWPFKKKARIIREAYQHREARDQKLIYHLGGPIFEPWMLAERRDNYEKLMAGARMLRDIDDLDTVTIAICSVCDKPMIIELSGNGKQSTIWLDCCNSGVAKNYVTVGARSFTPY